MKPTIEQIKEALELGAKVLISHPEIHGNWNAIIEGGYIICFRNSKRASYQLLEADLIAYTTNPDFQVQIDYGSLLKKELNELLSE